METTTKPSKFWDFIDGVDRHLYGRKMKNFVLGSIFVLIVAPLLDDFLEVPHDRLTHLTTFVFLVYVIVLFLAWVGAWRDDNGKLTWACTKSRLQTYWEVFRDTAEETRTSSKDENLYKLGWWLFFGSLCWKALQNVSVFIRKPMEKLFHTHMVKARHFELFTKHWYWVALVIGVGIMVYLYRTNKSILQRIKEDLLQLFSTRRPLNAGYNNELVKMDAEKLIVKNKGDGHIQEIITTDNSSLLHQFAAAMKEWNPGKYHYEYEYQNALYKHLKKKMKSSIIELEYPVGSKETGNRGRADIVIDETILIEMKRDSSAGAVQRAKGQILQYSDIWRNRGPVVLLLCNYEYEHAKLSFTSTMADLNKLERPVLTIVAEN